MSFFISSNAYSAVLKVFLSFYAIALLIWAYNIQPMHDYALYFVHWDLILGGDDPWMKIPAANAYGPIYNLFAWLYALDHQLPKLLFLTAWLGVMFYSVVSFWNIEKVKVQVKLIYTIFWVFNPFFVLSTVFYGLNDSFVASLVFFISNITT